MNKNVVNNIIGKCFNCEKELKEEDTHYITEEETIICEECFENLNYYICDICGKAIDGYRINYVDNENTYICDNCLESSNTYKICADCGSLFNYNNNGIQTASGDYICEDCRDNYFYCENCGKYYNIDEYNEDENGNPLCSNCYEEYENENLLRNYSYKPEINIQKTGTETEDEKNLFIGFELETEKSRSNTSRTNFCKKLNESINKPMNTDFLYFKEDGSLNNGVEIVSHPFTLDFFRKNEKLFRDICIIASNTQFTSHDPGTCGLHVHINKEYFGVDYNEQEKNIEKLILFFEFFKDKIQKFSRRTNFHYCHFLSDNGERKEKICNLKYIKENKDNSRYVAVNVENTNTVEIRIFRGTLNADTFIATLQWVFNLVRVIKNNPINKITWSKTINLEFTKSIKEYCKNRQIDNSYEHLKDYSIQETLLQKRLNKKLIILIEKEFIPELIKIQDNLIKNEHLENFKKSITEKGKYYDINKTFYNYLQINSASLEILKIQNLLNRAKKEFIDYDKLIQYFINYIRNIKYCYNNVTHRIFPNFGVAYNSLENLECNFNNKIKGL